MSRLAGNELISFHLEICIEQEQNPSTALKHHHSTIPVSLIAYSSQQSLLPGIL